MDMIFEKIHNYEDSHKLEDTSSVVQASPWAVAKEGAKVEKEEVKRIFEKLDDYKLKSHFDISTESNNKVTERTDTSEQEVPLVKL